VKALKYNKKWKVLLKITKITLNEEKNNRRQLIEDCKNFKNKCTSLEKQRRKLESKIDKLENDK